MSDRDESRPDGLVDARRRMGPGDGYADDDVSGHGMPEIRGAGDGFAATPRFPRRDALAGGSEDDAWAACVKACQRSHAGDSLACIAQNVGLCSSPDGGSIVPVAGQDAVAMPVF